VADVVSLVGVDDPEARLRHGAGSPSLARLPGNELEHKGIPNIPGSLWVNSTIGVTSVIEDAQSADVLEEFTQ
jgi:hypothetical protein